MRRFKIFHRTFYGFSANVQLQPHLFRLRPREGAELRIEKSSLNVEPEATLRWQRDVEDNTVARAEFTGWTSHLLIESTVHIQQFNVAPLDFVVDPGAIYYPFAYTAEDFPLLSPYLAADPQSELSQLRTWVASVWQPGETIQTYALLQRLCERIHQSFCYQIREEPGVQAPEFTINQGSGSCRDFAFLFIEAARHLGLAARFVSGYLNTPPSNLNYGSTHAWAEVYIPGAGWKGFDPTIGAIVGIDHTAIAVARLPASVPPVEGSFVGAASSSLDVGVWVTPLD